MAVAEMARIIRRPEAQAGFGHQAVEALAQGDIGLTHMAHRIGDQFSDLVRLGRVMRQANLGHAVASPGDVVRVRRVLTLQADHHETVGIGRGMAR